MSQKSPPSSFWIFCNRMYVNESQRVPPFHFSALCDIFRKKKYQVFSKKNFCSQLGKKLFPSHIEHERHTLGVSKVISKLFMNTSWAYLNNLRFLSLRYSADSRRSRLVTCLRKRSQFSKYSVILGQRFLTKLRLFAKPGKTTPFYSFRHCEIFQN